MFEAICYGILSLLAGGFAELYNDGWGAVVSISVIGVGIIAALNRKKE
ncbi:MAG: hypothetical protein IJ375_04685 [Oscillospiraceae bacterium]|nr:hypothetical protein [Oscillospiraceae bacterium]